MKTCKRCLGKGIILINSGNGGWYDFGFMVGVGSIGGSSSSRR
jgi:hypothetical protein